MPPNTGGHDSAILTPFVTILQPSSVYTTPSTLLRLQPTQTTESLIPAKSNETSKFKTLVEPQSGSKLSKVKWMHLQPHTSLVV